MTPAFANAFVFWMLATRATICASPSIHIDATLNESVVPQMSEPAPLTVKVPDENDAEPATPTAPASRSNQFPGSALLGGGGGGGVLSGVPYTSKLHNE